jgi:hypothetical protein
MPRREVIPNDDQTLSDIEHLPLLSKHLGKLRSLQALSVDPNRDKSHSIQKL